MKTKLISLLVLLCWLPRAVAQDYSSDLNTLDPYRLLPSTPTAMALARSINCPVHHGTGVADVKIPLYDLEVNDIKIPIYLSYHGSGIRVRDPYSWVGAGWTLHAEPVITRSVVGKPDENGYLYDTFVYPNTGNRQDLYDWQYANSLDKMPDRFYYSLPEKSGEFFFSHSENRPATAVIHPYEPLRLEWDATLHTFTLTDENGMVYTFGSSESTGNSNTYICTTQTVGNTLVPCEWKCRNITSPVSGTQVDFSYKQHVQNETGDNDFLAVEAAYLSSGSTTDEYVKRLLGCGAIFRDSYNRTLTCYDTSLAEVAPNFQYGTNEYLFPRPVTGHVLNDRLPESITCGDYKVLFHTANLNGHPCLYEMYVYHKEELVRHIRFDISPLGTLDGTSYYAEHCCLDGITVMGTDGSAGEQYTFSYYNKGNFPLKNSRSLDFWGYNNGANNTSKSLVAAQGINIYSKNSSLCRTIAYDGADRAPYLQAAITGTLSSITWPTGGSTSFEYEFHEYSEPTEATSLYLKGGGLRVKKITDNPVEGTRVVRNFSYSAGICRYPVSRYHDNPHAPFVRYFQKDQKIFYYTQISADNPAAGYGKIETLQHYYPAHPLMDPNFVQGPPVVYEQVTESRSDGSKTLYEYRQKEMTSYPELPPRDARDGWGYNCLKRQTEYVKDASSGEYRKTKTTDYRYDFFNSSSCTGYLFEDDVKCVGSFSSADAEYATPYAVRLLSGCRRTGCVTDSLFDASGNVSVETTSYSYRPDGSTSGSDPLVMQRSRTTVFGDGSTRTERTHYPADLILEGEAEAARLKLLEMNRQQVTLLSEEVQDGTPVQTVGYGYVLDEDSLPRLSSIALGRDTADVERIRYSHHNSQGKPRYKVTDGIRHTVYLYSYDGERLVAEIKNATYEEVETALGTVFIDTLNEKIAEESDFDTLEALETEYPEWYISLFKHSIGNGVTYMKSPGGLPQSYDYDNFHRLSAIYIYQADDTRTMLEKFSYKYTNP